MRAVSSKVRRQPSGKENGAVIPGSKSEYGMETGAAPPQRITRAPSATSGYVDRYGDQPTSYGQQQQQQWAA